MMDLIKYILVVLLQIISMTGYTLTLSKDAKISVMTCEPGNQLYSLFGHTALRITDPAHKLDQVFNYGTFDFNTPNFYMKFAKGLLPYQFTNTKYKNFLREYQHKQISVYSQTLLLDSVQRQRLMDLVIENLLPQNKTYLYNYLYDNCSTRCRDLVINAVDADVFWNMEEESKSFWNLLDEYLNVQPWSQWGIHTILGQDGTQQAKTYEYMFLPDYLLKGLKTAAVNNRLLASKPETIYKAPQRENDNRWYFVPLFVFSVFAMIVLALNYFTHSVKVLNISLSFLLIATGIVGCLIIFLGFFTLHPLTFPNWNIMWANPLNLLVGFFVFSSKAIQVVRYYLLINIVILGLALLLWPILFPAVPIASVVLIIMLMCVYWLKYYCPHDSRSRLRY